MNLIEILLIFGFGALVIVAIWQIFFSKKKKKDKKEKKPKEKKAEKEKPDSKPKEDKTKQKQGSGKEQPKVEPVVKSAEKKDDKQKEDKSEPAKTESVEKEKTLEKEKEKKGLYVIRPHTELKINKKALKNGSRNPSVSRVFDKNGNKIEIEQEEKIQEPEEQVHATDVKKKPVERFGTREYEYSEQNDPWFFQINAPKGSPLRAPTIGDRTHFTERLHVSEDGNLSGITGIGVHGAIASAESQAKQIEQKNQEMLSRVDDSLRNPNFGEALMQYGGSFEEKKNTKSRGEKILDKIDPETMIIVDAINNPRHKNNKTTKF